MLKIDESLMAECYEALVKIARVNPNEVWGEKENHDLLTKIIYFARRKVHGSRKPVESLGENKL